jgi:hypothetical protein
LSFFLYRVPFLRYEVRVNISWTTAIGYITAYVPERTIFFTGRTFIRRNICPESIPAIRTLPLRHILPPDISGFSTHNLSCYIVYIRNCKPCKVLTEPLRNIRAQEK